MDLSGYLHQLQLRIHALAAIWQKKLQKMTNATVCSISYLSILYLLAKLSELLIHRLGSPKCVVAGIYVCSDILFFIKRIAKQKVRVEKMS